MDQTWSCSSIEPRENNQGQLGGTQTWTWASMLGLSLASHMEHLQFADFGVNAGSDVYISIHSYIRNMKCIYINIIDLINNYVYIYIYISLQYISTSLIWELAKPNFSNLL